MAEIRMVTDKELLTEAFEWGSAAPRWFIESQEKETLKEFLSSADEKLFYGIWDKEFTSLIRLTPFARRVFEIDLFAKRETNLDVLTEAGRSVRDYLYDKGIAQGFFGWIPVFNRGIVKLYRNLGFRHAGITCYRGTTHGRPVKWLLMTDKEM